MTALLRDLRHAVRALGRSPGFTVVAVLTLALGIGANTAIFSVVNGVLLRSLPFQQPDRLVRLYTAYPDDDTHYEMSPPDFMSYHEEADVFSGVAAYAPTEQTLTGRGEPTQAKVGLVSADLFQVMGVAPMLGRVFRPEENQAGRNGVVVLSHAYWQQRFGEDPRVIGTTLMLNGISREVVGVLPAGFDFPDDRDLYYPLSYDERYSATTARGRRGEFLGVVARLKDGVSPEKAEAAVGTLSGRLKEEFPGTNGNVRLAMVPLRSELLGDVSTPLFLLFGAVGLVLLIACVNVANLLLARSSARDTEVAVRAALGAGRGRLVRQLLAESVVLGAAGGAAGLLLAVWGTQALVAARPQGIPRLDEVGVDGTVVGFAVLAALLTSVLFGLIPALQTTRGDLTGALREGGRGGAAGRHKTRLRGGLVVVETALAVVLLVGAGLLLRSFARLTQVDPGFRTEHVLTYDVRLPSSSYEDGAAVRNFYGQLMERTKALPGVASVGASSNLPLTGAGIIWGFAIENRPPPPPGTVQDLVVKLVTPDYLSTLGIPLRRGRAFSDRDRQDAPQVVMLNEAAAKRYFPNENPVGHRISFDGDTWAEIVGVVADVPQYGVAEPARAEVYAPFAQLSSSSMTVALRTTGDPMALTRSIRAEVNALDPDLPLERFTTTAELVRESTSQPRFYTALLALFAAVALALAAIGIFGVMSFTVAQRTREIGIRMALGADPRGVIHVVVGGALGLAAAGLALGLLGALAGARLLSGLLYGVGTTDPITFAGVAVLLLSVAFLASYLPARRATRVDPMSALRAE